jgi:N6-L-threonylcarbamoyladenine synthase
MKKSVVLGFDTSNYTTSVAIISEEGDLIANIKRPLPVKAGERGLRQSDALFAHVKNMPDALKEAEEYLQDKVIAAIGVSERPRNLEGSYMPCFLAGVNTAIAAALASKAPLYRYSHQCGHIAAAIYSSENEALLEGRFAAFHVSGGTTELLSVKRADNGFIADHIGGTRDLNAGQIVDRIGVAMGLPFPAGPHIEALALFHKGKIPKRKISRDGLWLNLSGLENICLKLYKDTDDKALVSAFVLEYIASALLELSLEYIKLHGDAHFVFAGGVMSNSIIKAKLSANLNCSFAEPSMSADNAVGIAYLSLLEHKLRHGE